MKIAIIRLIVFMKRVCTLQLKCYRPKFYNS
uniref:Uncharacterized protein n=1 Tax=Rhizophora mucronata TaxID=61149 RepID=A0A2P2NPH2_RHIMU